uniref:(northern house mosquito) hypothetical protein n=1 Tax=Culex pipiens TaxID=7175 RepID=A0A8D8DBY6_CULPI
MSTRVTGGSKSSVNRESGERRSISTRRGSTMDGRRSSVGRSMTSGREERSGTRRGRSGMIGRGEVVRIDLATTKNITTISITARNNINSNHGRTTATRTTRNQNTTANPQRSGKTTNTAMIAHAKHPARANHTTTTRRKNGRTLPGKTRNTRENAISRRTGRSRGLENSGRTIQANVVTASHRTTRRTGRKGPVSATGSRTTRSSPGNIPASTESGRLITGRKSAEVPSGTGISGTGARITAARIIPARAPI